MKHILLPPFRLFWFILGGTFYYFIRLMVFIVVYLWEFNYKIAIEESSWDFHNTAYHYGSPITNPTIYNTPFDYLIKRNCAIK